MSETHDEIYEKAMEALSKGMSNSRHTHNSGARKLSEADFVLGLPLELNWEMVEEMTLDFKTRILDDESGEFMAYEGLQPFNGSYVMVKRYTGDLSSILEKEKKAAMSMRHQNILGLTASYHSEHTTVLVFPFTKRGTLQTTIYGGSRGKLLKLTFQDKLKIAIGIARGIRYMHEECPQGPIVHGDLNITNVYLRDDLRPMISGFGRCKWLHLNQTKPVSSQRCSLREHLDREAMALVKSDIHSYGVLLLRLFCKSSAPQDDKPLTEWARPLLLCRASHDLMDEECWEDVDVHELFRVMSTAYMCTMSSPDKRPCMSEIISYLKGESFCDIQTSPSSR